MPFILGHDLVSQPLYLERHDTAAGTYFTTASEGSFDLLFPGVWQKTVIAKVRHSMRIDPPNTDPPPLPHGIDDPTHGGLGGGFGGGPGGPLHPDPVTHPLHNGVQVDEEGLTYDLRIYDPGGHLFTHPEITLADLKKFRDLRGVPHGQWRYTLLCVSKTYQLHEALNETVSDEPGSISLALLETVPSSSAAPLVSRTRVDAFQRFTFDLNRVGDFIAANFASFPFSTWHGTMRLLDPDGHTVASTAHEQLRCPIPLAALGKSRDSTGRPRLWTLEVSAQGGVVVGNRFVTATVIGAGRFSTAGVLDRLEKMIGPHGSFLHIEGRNEGQGKDAKAELVLTITDVAAAETIDMQKLLKTRLEKEGQSTDVEANKPMVLYHHKSDYDHDVSIDVSSLRVRSIDVAIGPSQHLGAGIPVVRLTIAIDGEVRVKWNGLTLATASLNHGEAQMEVGVGIDPDGTPRVVQWVPDEPFDIDFSTAAIATYAATLAAIGAAGGAIAGGGIGAIAGALGGLFDGVVTAEVVEEYIEYLVNEKVSQGAAELFDDPTLAPSIMMVLFGAHLTYLPVRFDGGDILFEHVAPLEPDPHPRLGYAGAIGRVLLDEAIGHIHFVPMSLGDTWAADNLRARIDHIVLVMMENRSYDHVLGYRSIAPLDEPRADGWNPDLIDTVATAVTPPGSTPDPNGQPPVGPLRNSAFALNAVNLRTQIPKSVGHKLANVHIQLAGAIDGPDGRRIIDPNGFVDDFREHSLGDKPEGEDGVVPFDVLRYYEKDTAVTDANTGKPVDDLPMYGFLSEQYGYCDRYFAAHPGPTVPNRMYSLSGDTQYDRLGVPLLDNNFGEDFQLSRAQTIFDILTRQGVSWRVYESFPSVTMLRMFARYATDNAHIGRLENFVADAAAGTLPSFTVVEPAMHSHPENDDHPHADMYRGQGFVRTVYEALRSGPAWERTLLLITYDEHGGFYDHVLPPVADVLEPPFLPPMATTELISAGDPGGGSGTSVGPHGTGLFIRPELLGLLMGDAVLTGTEPTDPTIRIPYGVRVPTFVVSPWVAPGRGPTLTLDHCSILKTVLARFCPDMRPFLSDRVHVSHTLETFLTESAPRLDVGDPPPIEDLPITAPWRLSSASQITTPVLYRKRLREEQVDYQEISGRLARMLGR